jgi:hypothetical protein
MSREYTSKLLDLIEDGMLDRDTVIMACVKYMSEADVKDMMESNEFILEEDEDEDDMDCDDSDDGYALASAGFGTDEDYGGYDD